MTSRASPLAPAPLRPLRVAVLVAAISGIAFVAGRWVKRTLEPSAPGPAPRAAETRAAPPDAEEFFATPRVEPFARAAPSAPAAPAAAPRRDAPAPAAPTVVQRVTEEARAQIEAARDRLGERCAPRSLQDGRAPARLVLNLTFDREGREIARGVIQDRRTRSAQLAGCLRELPRLEVTPPSVNVGVAIPVTF